jgi:fatty acid desaturase
MNECLDDTECRSEYETALEEFEKIDNFRERNCVSVPAIVLLNTLIPAAVAVVVVLAVNFARART